jgi:Smg protein
MMTFRVLGPHERGRFAPEAWGHLLALTGSGALNAAELEHIIERALCRSMVVLRSMTCAP